MIPSSGCPPWRPDHPRTLPRTGNPTPPRGARKQDLKGQRSWYSERASTYKQRTQVLGLLVIGAGAVTSFVQVFSPRPWVPVVTAALGAIVVLIDLDRIPHRLGADEARAAALRERGRRLPQRGRGRGVSALRRSHRGHHRRGAANLLAEPERRGLSTAKAQASRSRRPGSRECLSSVHAARPERVADPDAAARFGKGLSDQGGVTDRA